MSIGVANKVFKLRSQIIEDNPIFYGYKEWELYKELKQVAKDANRLDDWNEYIRTEEDINCCEQERFYKNGFTDALKIIFTFGLYYFVLKHRAS